MQKSSSSRKVKACYVITNTPFEHPRVASSQKCFGEFISHVTFTATDRFDTFASEFGAAVTILRVDQPVPVVSPDIREPVVTMVSGNDANHGRAFAYCPTTNLAGHERCWIPCNHDALHWEIERVLTTEHMTSIVEDDMPLRRLVEIAHFEYKSKSVGLSTMFFTPEKEDRCCVLQSTADHKPVLVKLTKAQFLAMIADRYLPLLKKLLVDRFLRGMPARVYYKVAPLLEKGTPVGATSYVPDFTTRLAWDLLAELHAEVCKGMTLEAALMDSRSRSTLGNNKKPDAAQKIKRIKDGIWLGLRERWRCDDVNFDRRRMLLNKGGRRKAKETRRHASPFDDVYFVQEDRTRYVMKMDVPGYKPSGDIPGNVSEFPPFVIGAPFRYEPGGSLDELPKAYLRFFE